MKNKLLAVVASVSTALIFAFVVHAAAPSSPNLWVPSGKNISPISGYGVVVGNATATNLTVTGTCTGCASGSGNVPSNGIPGQFLGNTATNTPGWILPYTITVGPAGSSYLATGTNDNIGLQNAIGSISQGQIFTKKGNYNLASNVLLGSNQQLAGEGAGTLFNTSGPSILASGTIDSAFQSFAMNGSGETTTPLNGVVTLRVRNSQDLKASNLTFRQCNGFCFFTDSIGTSSTSSNITIANSFFQGTGLQDVVGGGSHVSDGSSSTSNLTLIGNQIQQITSAGGTVGSTLDPNCFDMVQVYGMNLLGNNCAGDLVFGTEQIPNAWSQISHNIVEPVLGATKVSGDIAVQTGSFSTTATHTPTGISVLGNTLPGGGIAINGDSANISQSFIVANNNIQTSTSSYQSYRTAQNGIEIGNASDALVTGNSLTAALGATNTTGIKAGNGAGVAAVHTVFAFNNLQNFTTGIDLQNGTANKSIFNNFVGVTNPVVNGSNIIGMDDNGNVSIGTTTYNGRLFVQGVSPTNNLFALASSTGSNVLTVSPTGRTVITDNSTETTPLLVTSSNVGGGTRIAINRSTTTKDAMLELDTSGVGTQWFFGVRSSNIISDGNTLAVDYWNGAADILPFVIKSSGTVGVGTTTPVANFQVANGANATTTAEFGSAGQNKGTCIKLYRSDGSAIYASVAAGATAFTLSTTACANISGF